MISGVTYGDILTKLRGINKNKIKESNVRADQIKKNNLACAAHEK